MTTLPRTPRQRKPLAAAAGSCRWLSKPATRTSAGVLEINGTSYEVFAILNDQETAVVGYRLCKADDTLYDLNADLSECDCPDYIFNRAHAATEELRLCKHCKSLRAALVLIS